MSPESSAIPGIVCAGALSSLGPCVAPRLLAVAGAVSGMPPLRALATAAAFVTGLAAVNCAVAEGSAVCAQALHLSGILYGALAAALAAGGGVKLWRGERPGCEGCAVAPKGTGLGAAALLGASSGFVLSPCCTPMLLAAAAFAAQSGGARDAAFVAAIYTAAHAVPLFAFAGGAGALLARLRRERFRAAVSVASAVLTLALAGYYAVLA